MLLAAFIYGLILIELHTDFRNGNILDIFVFQHNRAKVKVTVAVRRKLFSWPGQSPGRAIVLPQALALVLVSAAAALAKSLTLKFFM